MALLAKDYALTRYRPAYDSKLPKEKQSMPEFKPKIGFSDYAPIVANGLFGQPGELSFIDTSTYSIEGLSQKNPAGGSIILTGTVVSPLKKNYAIFEDVISDKQEVFRETEQVFGVGVLYRVEKDKAYIMASGRMIPFSMPMEMVHGSKEVLESTLPPRPNVQYPSPLVSQKVGENEWVIDQRMIAKTMDDMSKVLTDARLLPYKEDDKIIGFRVSEIKPEGVFNLIGLKNGDILLKVNNYKIDSPEKGVQLLTGLKGESSISLDIIRDGQRMNLKYQIR